MRDSVREKDRGFQLIYRNVVYIILSTCIITYFYFPVYIYMLSNGRKFSSPNNIVYYYYGNRRSGGSVFRSCFQLSALCFLDVSRLSVSDICASNVNCQLLNLILLTKNASSPELNNHRRGRFLSFLEINKILKSQVA